MTFPSEAQGQFMSVQYPGLFITVEGIDGAGKSTHLPYIHSVFRKEGFNVLETREPGGTPVANKLRDILLQETLAPETELLLMFAARNEHLQKSILPALSEGKCVLCDRFTDSSYAYQGGGRGIDNEIIQHLETWVQHDIKPDLTLYFDLSVELSLERRALRNQEHNIKDRFEDESPYFFERVRQGYLDRIKQQPHRFYVLNGADSIPIIQERLSDFLKDWLRYYNTTDRHPMHG
ncbi:MAG: dTMP kinase [Pseudomonadota bacterium]